MKLEKIEVTVRNRGGTYYARAVRNGVAKTAQSPIGACVAARTAAQRLVGSRLTSVDSLDGSQVNGKRFVARARAETTS